MRPDSLWGEPWGGGFGIRIFLFAKLESEYPQRLLGIVFDPTPDVFDIFLFSLWSIRRASLVLAPDIALISIQLEFDKRFYFYTKI